MTGPSKNTSLGVLVRFQHEDLAADVPFVPCLTRALRLPSLLVVKGEQPVEVNCGISEDRPSVWELAKSCCSNLRTEENSRAWQEHRHQEVRWKKFLHGWWPGCGYRFISIWVSLTVLRYVACHMTISWRLPVLWHFWKEFSLRVAVLVCKTVL